MRARIYWFVSLIVVAAAVAAATVAHVLPSPSTVLSTDVLILSVLALAGEALSILLPRSAVGSMGGIAYFALALVVPNWPALAAVAVVRSTVELWSRREAIKAVFNVAVHVLMEAVAIAVYIALGGRALPTLTDLSHLTHVTQAVGGAALVACVAAQVLNTGLVATVIALSSGRPAHRVWLEINRSTIGADLLSMPVIFIFAWVYAAFGAIATATLWVPILGLRQLQRTNLELERTNEELLELMVKSLEARDPYTSGHSRRVHHYSTVIARALGLSEKQIEQIGRAALLHDVGKIHEKYAAVLAKTEKLSSEEWALIQEHPVDGANLVATMTKLRDVVPAIRHHHENWDGTGYPDGLAGELIPLSSRIIRFADTIDAMTTERPYRAPLTEPQVRAEVVRCRASQFDPMIADKLLSSPLWPTLFAPGTLHTSQPVARVLSMAGDRRREAVAKSS